MLQSGFHACVVIRIVCCGWCAAEQVLILALEGRLSGPLEIKHGDAGVFIAAPDITEIESSGTATCAAVRKAHSVRDSQSDCDVVCLHVQRTGNASSRAPIHAGERA